MTTSEERLHVAAMLYDEAADFRNLCEKYDNEWTIDLGDVPAVFQDIAHYLGFDGVVRADELFERLADLIDPTCKVSSVETYYDELGQLGGWEFHLTCGHSFQRPWNEPPAYCPECGARVVSDDE